MKRNTISDEDRRSIGDFFRTWGDLVGAVDFRRARDLYVEDVIAFGSLGKMGAVIARTKGIHKDGSHFDRPVRVTATLMRPSVDAPWLATHTHVSLTPGTPAPSYGNKPEAQ